MSIRERTRESEGVTGNARLTGAVLGAGLAAIAVGRRPGWVLTAHRASFILWFGVTTVHVLGHILETPALAFADWRLGRSRHRLAVRGAKVRIGALIGTIAVGIAPAVVLLGWIGAWRHRARCSQSPRSAA